MSISRLCECIASEPTLIPPRCEIILFLRNSGPPEPHESIYDLFPAFFGIGFSSQLLNVQNFSMTYSS